MVSHSPPCHNTRKDRYIRTTILFRYIAGLDGLRGPIGPPGQPGQPGVTGATGSTGPSGGAAPPVGVAAVNAKSSGEMAENKCRYQPKQCNATQIIRTDSPNVTFMRKTFLVFDCSFQTQREHGNFEGTNTKEF